MIAGNLDHPARELMWGAPGTMLAALFLHQRTREPRWAALYVATARKLWSQLRWSPEFQCSYWTQDLYGRESTFLDAVHGFVATAAPLIQGRHLLESGEWDAWQRCIVNTIRRTALRDGGQANWPAVLYSTRPQELLLQFCHGAPGFVICLAELPSNDLDDLLLAEERPPGRRARCGKGPTSATERGGNGYAFLNLHERTGDARWLDRARASRCTALRKPRPTPSSTDSCATRSGPAIPASRSTFGVASAARVRSRR